MRTRVVNFINAGGGYITSSRRTVQLGYTYGIWEIPYTKINQVDASYTGRTVQRRAPLDILTLWFRWSEMPSHANWRRLLTCALILYYMGNWNILISTLDGLCRIKPPFRPFSKIWELCYIQQKHTHLFTQSSCHFPFNSNIWLVVVHFLLVKCWSHFLLKCPSAFPSKGGAAYIAYACIGLSTLKFQKKCSQKLRKCFFFKK